MNSKLTNQFQEVLNHLYISPLEKCNLRCKICYTGKTNQILSEKEILNFINKYEKVHKLETVTFCGGEVFTLLYFPDLVNTLTTQKKLVQIITNGTIDKLKELMQPNLINLIVSLDGLTAYHDQNRGKDSFAKSLNLIKKAYHLGFHAEIFSIVTRQNLSQINDFEKLLKKSSGFNVTITYHPRKPMQYLINHPVSNIKGAVNGFDFLTKKELLNLIKHKNTFPPKSLGCYQVSLMSNGKIYGCCEGTVPIGSINDKIETLINNLQKRLGGSNLACSQPDFICGMKNVYAS